MLGYIRDRKHQYILKQWPKRESLTLLQKHVVNTPLINPEKVYLALFHIKLELTKNFIKAMDQNSTGLMYLKDKVPRISDATIKEGVFVGPQIRELIQSVKSEDQLREVEKVAQKSFKYVTTSFLGNHKAENYHDMAADLVQSNRAMGCNMSLKVHLIGSHFDYFAENLRAVAMSLESDFTRTFTVSGK